MLHEERCEEAGLRDSESGSVSQHSGSSECWRVEEVLSAGALSVEGVRHL